MKLPRLARPIKPSEITPESLFNDRRRLLQGAALAATIPLPALAASNSSRKINVVKAGENIGSVIKSAYRVDGKTNPYEDITTYNNYYEFGTDKESPAINAQALPTQPWRLKVDGLVEKPMEFDIDDLARLAPIEERIYRFRCVEAWSMVVPWNGFSLASLLKAVKPMSSAKYVEFITYYDAKVMSKLPVLDWPYNEALRIDEAMHPLTLLTLGVYGKWLPKQNGAPVRLIVPWKYGFKSAKSLVQIRLTDKMPRSAWMKAGPSEYGFYANVNPNVSHPRWSQARERRLGQLFKQDTLMFNGYEQEVAQLYAGMDLRKFY